MISTGCWESSVKPVQRAIVELSDEQEAGPAAGLKPVA